MKASVYTLLRTVLVREGKLQESRVVALMNMLVQCKITRYSVAVWTVGKSL